MAFLKWMSRSRFLSNDRPSLAFIVSLISLFSTTGLASSLDQLEQIASKAKSYDVQTYGRLLNLSAWSGLTVGQSDAINNAGALPRIRSTALKEIGI